MRLWTLLAILWLVALSAPLARAQTAGDLQGGGQLFEGLCARCHGIDGSGGEGPTLNRPKLPRAATDDELRDLIREGIPSRGMPRTRRLSPNEMRQIVAYVRSLGRTISTPVAGDAAHGRQIYDRLGCAACHMIEGEGGSVGPELTAIGLQRGPDYLREAVLDPAARLPRGLLVVPSRGYAEYLPVRIIDTGGQEIRGVRVNEDSFTIQVRDLDNQFHSFRKSAVKEIVKEHGRTVMPSYRDRLTDADAGDLTAFLASLGGAR